MEGLIRDGIIAIAIVAGRHSVSPRYFFISYEFYYTTEYSRTRGQGDFTF